MHHTINANSAQAFDALMICVEAAATARGVEAPSLEIMKTTITRLKDECIRLKATDRAFKSIMQTVLARLIQTTPASGNMSVDEAMWFFHKEEPINVNAIMVMIERHQVEFAGFRELSFLRDYGMCNLPRVILLADILEDREPTDEDRSDGACDPLIMAGIAQIDLWLFGTTSHTEVFINPELPVPEGGAIDPRY